MSNLVFGIIAEHFGRFSASKSRPVHTVSYFSKRSEQIAFLDCAYLSPVVWADTRAPHQNC